MFFPLLACGLTECLEEGSLLVTTVTEFLQIEADRHRHDVTHQHGRMMDNFEVPVFNFLGHYQNLLESVQLLSVRYPQFLTYLPRSRVVLRVTSEKLTILFNRQTSPVPGFFSTIKPQITQQESSNSNLHQLHEKIELPNHDYLSVIKSKEINGIQSTCYSNFTYPHVSKQNSGILAYPPTSPEKQNTQHESDTGDENKPQQPVKSPSSTGKTPDSDRERKSSRRRKRSIFSIIGKKRSRSQSKSPAIHESDMGRDNGFINLAPSR